MTKLIVEYYPEHLTVISSSTVIDIHDIVCGVKIIQNSPPPNKP